MKRINRGDVVTVPDHVLMEGIKSQFGRLDDDIVIMQYRVASGRLCTVSQATSRSVVVLANFTDRRGVEMHSCHVYLPLELLVQQGDDHTIKVSSLDYTSSDILSDEDKLIIKGYMQNV